MPERFQRKQYDTTLQSKRSEDFANKFKDLENYTSIIIKNPEAREPFLKKLQEAFDSLDDILKKSDEELQRRDRP